MDLGESGCVWYVCKVCSKAFQESADFWRHRARAHRPKTAGSNKEQVPEKENPPQIQVPPDPTLTFHKSDKELLLSNEIRIGGSDYEFDTIDTSSLFKLEPVSMNEWESNFGEEMRDIMYTLKNLDEFPQNNNTKNTKSTKMKRPKPNKVKTIPCEKCDKLFTSIYTRKTHMKIHEGEKPFECEHCGKHFTQKINLKYHVRIHTGEKPHVCTFCKKGFAQVANLSTHIRRCHGPAKEK